MLCVPNKAEQSLTFSDETSYTLQDAKEEKEKIYMYYNN